MDITARPVGGDYRDVLPPVMLEVWTPDGVKVALRLGHDDARRLARELLLAEQGVGARGEVS